MEHIPIHGPDIKSKAGALATVLLAFFSRITIPSVSELAAYAAVFAGVSTGLYTCWKWYTEWRRLRYKNRNHADTK